MGNTNTNSGSLKRTRIKDYLLCLFSFFLFISTATALPIAIGTKGVFTNEVNAPAAGANLSLGLPTVTQFPNTFKKGLVKVRTDFGGNYEFGKSTGDAAFELEVAFDLVLLDGATTISTSSHSFIINNENPEGLFFMDLRDHILAGTPTGLDIDQVQLTNVTVTDQLSGPASFADAINNLQAYLGYEIAMGMDVRMTGSAITLNTPVAVSSKVMQFTWTPDRQYPNYQFQILRLYNNSEATATDETVITATINWDNAVTIETETSTPEVTLTLGEGQGYYAWRVRPVGTFFKGGIANDMNWGQYNSTTMLNDGQTISVTTSGDELFFYTDPDDDKNYIYSRVFTEGNKVSETITYANSLQQVRQTQTHLPSKGKTVTSQTVLDNVGRPAMTTLPVPQSGKLDGYKEQFVTIGGKIYKAEDFDENGNFLDPGTVDENAAFGYYSDNGPDAVPSAEGYPYSRVLFYNDGTGRVKEQTGVGKTHMLGDQDDGRGRTVRTLYAAPSEDELVALFGDEAPSPEAVQKVITIDQNNTATITYTSKEGNVIATALTFLDEDNAGAGETFEQLSEETPEINVSEKIKKNIKTDSGFVSSKRVVFLEETELSVEYQIECKKIENLCVDIEANCGYQVTIIIHNVDDPEAGDIIMTSDLGEAAQCEEVIDCGADMIEAKVVSGAQWNISPLGLDPSALVLQPGTYIVEKHLTVSDDVSVTIEDNQERIDNQIRPLSDYIIGRLNDVDCEAELLIFYSDLIHLANQFNKVGGLTVPTVNFDCPECSQTSLTFPQSSDPNEVEQFWDIYIENRDLYSIMVFDNGEVEIEDTDFQTNPAAVRIVTPCCSIDLDVRFTPPFRCPATFEQVDQDGDDIIEVNRDFINSPDMSEYFPDFEGYGIAILKECVGAVNDQLPPQDQVSDAEVEQAAADIFYAHLAGWEPGEFNQMVFHMLTDKYSCQGTDPTDVTCDGEPSPDPTPDPPPPPTEPIDPCDPPETNDYPATQYQCALLADCWTQQMLILKDAYCPDALLDLAALGATGNVSNAVDGNEGEEEGEGETHNEHFDDGFEGGFFLIRWIAKRKISKRMRDLQAGGFAQLSEEDEPFYTFHLANEFLNCTGFKFADIIAPDDPQFNPGYPVNSPETQRCDGTWMDEDPQGTGVTTDGRIPLDYDFDDNPDNGDYVPKPSFQGTLIEFDIDPNTGDIVFDPNGKTVEEFFPNIQSPIYAFKYFEYQEGDLPTLEFHTCFRDPNICLDPNTRDREPCCGGDLVNPLPCDFCGSGQVSCEFTKEDWSCGQRFTFFTMLKDFVQPPPNWAETQDQITCDWMEAPREWYTNPQTSDDIALDFISEEQYLEFIGPTLPTPVLQPELETTVDPNNPRQLDENTFTSIVSFVERKAREMEHQCHTRCLDRREEFRQAVIDMFNRRCYVIGDCKVATEDNIVPAEDIELLVDKMVMQCQSQCPVTTFTCEDRSCRLTNTSIFENFENPTLGPNGTNFDESVLQLGVGGHTQIDAGTCETGTNTMVECDPALNHSFKELTLWTQAMQWLPELDIISKCNANGEFVDTDGDGISDPVLVDTDDDGVGDQLDPNRYYYNEDGELVQQTTNPTIECDPEADENGTFVERDDYKVNPNQIPDANNPDIGDPVESPKVGIDCEIQP